ncbi:MAG: hypothetical protein WA350_07070 [Candidatus Sulfotelmatobacter sp.]
MDPKTAGLKLYGLQTASANLTHTKFEAEKATDVVIDRHSVDQTCINGPQWFARDFADGVEEGEPSRAAASGEKVQAEVPSGKVRADKRKTPERAGIEEAPEWARDIVRSLLSETTGAEARVGAG